MTIKNLANLTKPKKILGIDASTNTVAFCLYSEKGPEKWGEITFQGKTVFERLADAQKKVPGLLLKYDYDMIVFESAIFVQNKKTVVLLAYAFGAIVGALTKRGTVVEDIPPITWQNAIGNKPLTKTEKDVIKNANPDKSKSWYDNTFRETRKQRTMDWVKTNFNIDAANDNVSDAIAIAHVGWSKFGS